MQPPRLNAVVAAVALPVLLLAFAGLAIPTADARAIGLPGAALNTD